jgi:hypothetical protein
MLLFIYTLAYLTALAQAATTLSFSRELCASDSIQSRVKIDDVSCHQTPLDATGVFPTNIQSGYTGSLHQVPFAQAHC